MTQQPIPDNLVTLGAIELRRSFPGRSKRRVMVESALTLEPVMAYLRDRVARGPHDYECGLFPPPWVKDTSTWVHECDCTVKHILYLLDHGVFEPNIEEWIAAKDPSHEGTGE